MCKETARRAGGDIVPDNIRAAGAIYYAAMLEEMKLFDVVDRLAQLFAQGLLPIGNRQTGQTLMDYALNRAGHFLGEAERKVFYTVVIGTPGGDAGGEPNRDFDDVWMRFVAAVVGFSRYRRRTCRMRSAEAAVRKAGRDLAANLSLYGFPGTHLAAKRLVGQIDTCIDLLNDHDIRTAYGARSAWQVIERVSQTELGGAANTNRYRVLATRGERIIRFLAEHHAGWSSDDPLISVSGAPAAIPIEDWRRLRDQVEEWVTVRAAMAETDTG